MKNRKELTKEYNDVLKTEYKKIDSIKKKENSGYRYYGNAWATVVSIDIVGFKEIVKKLNNQDVVKIVQLFTDTVVSTANESGFKDIFRDAYFAGDEVLVVFETNTKEKINRSLDFAFFINTIVNDVLSEALISNIPLLTSFNAGIGVWTSNDNTLVYSGYKGSGQFVSSTLIGSAINFSSKLASIANRRGYPSILINKSVNENLIGTKQETANKYMKQYNLGGDIGIIYGGNIVKTMYNK
ncbi:MAG: hypothetical protein KAG14_04610 [Mycoplasmataceae bacterium]|nr:hypothetical protein [Mycoplasmataceae bacterium]